MIITATQFHFIASFISGILLVIVGLAVLLRQKNSIINRLFFCFFELMGFYELLTAVQVILLNGTMIFVNNGTGAYIMSGTTSANIIRALLTISFILALASGALATLIINYGEADIMNLRTLGLGAAVTVLLLIIAVTGESTSMPTVDMMKQMIALMGGMMSNVVYRTNSGWIGFYISIILFATIIVIMLGIRVKNDKGSVQSKLLRLLIGSLLVIGVLAFFDYIQVTGNFMFIMMNLETHALLHNITFIGEILILSAFWTPIRSPTIAIEETPPNIAPEPIS